MQLAVDTTLVSPLTAAGAPQRAAGRTEGAAVQQARRAKERTYPEFSRAARARLVIFAVEVGGRWSSEAAGFIRLLARARARNRSASSCAASISAYTQRWSVLLSFAAARSFAASLCPSLSLAPQTLKEIRPSSSICLQTPLFLRHLPAACLSRESLLRACGVDLALALRPLRLTAK